MLSEEKTHWKNSHYFILFAVHKLPIFKLASSSLSLHPSTAEADKRGVIVTKLVADGVSRNIFLTKFNLRADFLKENSYRVLCPSGHLTTSSVNIRANLFWKCNCLIWGSAFWNLLASNFSDKCTQREKRKLFNGLYSSTSHPCLTAPDFCTRQTTVWVQWSNLRQGEWLACFSTARML